MGSIEAAARTGLRLERLAPADADALVPLSVEAGWNQTVADWRFMLDAGQGFGVLDGRGGWAGSAVALPLGPALSWLCMVLVARHQRRRGLGTELLRCAVEAVRARGAAAGLDATEFGRPVYLPLGFSDLFSVSRWRGGVMTRPEPPPPDCTIRQAALKDVEAIIAFDEPRSAMRREKVLRYLFSSAPELALVAEHEGRIVGYGLGRPGRTTAQIGPIVADDDTVAVALASHGLTQAGSGALLDVPDRHRGLADWLAAHGAGRERGFVRMVLGDADADLAEPRAIYALAGAELG